MKFIVGEFGLYSVWATDCFGEKMAFSPGMMKRSIESAREKYGYDPEQYLLWKNAKHRIRQTLLGEKLSMMDFGSTSKSVIFVPQWAYHIDMTMLYVGQATIVMHSFKKQLELVHACSSALSNHEQLLMTIAALDETYGPVIEKARQILTKHGFQIIEVSGTFPLDVQDGHFNKGLASGNRALYFNFLNGLALSPNVVLVPHDKGTKGAHAALFNTAYEWFEKRLKEEGFTVVPVGNHLGGSIFNLNDFMYAQGGGFRCKTATLPSFCAPILEEVNRRRAEEDERKRKQAADQRKKQAEDRAALLRTQVEAFKNRLKELGLWSESFTQEEEEDSDLFERTCTQKMQEKVIQKLQEVKNVPDTEENPKIWAVLDLLD